MKRISRFDITPGEYVRLPLYPGDKIIMVGEQWANVVTIWAEATVRDYGGAAMPLDAKFTVEVYHVRTFLVLGTGDCVEASMEHRGSVICDGGRLVWHVYEVMR